MKKALSFDIGTSSVKASLWEESGVCLACAVKEYRTFASADGIIREQRPADWWGCICNAAKELLSSRLDKDDIVSIGLSGHSIGVVAVDEEGNLLCEKTPLWSDARAKEQAEAFFETIDYSDWYYDTGCGFPAPLYGIFKMMWYRDHLPTVYQKTKCFLGTKDYINFLLTGRMATDFSYVAGSGAYSLTRRQYEKKYIDAAGLDAEKFPEILAPYEVLGPLKSSIASDWGLTTIPMVVCGSVDNACMCLGAGCIHDGEAYASLGSSAWIAACSSSPALNLEKGIYTFPHCIENHYIPAAGIFSAGTSLEWVADSFFADLDKEERMKIFDSTASEAAIGANGLLFCPVMAGGSCVDASADMRGGFGGLTLGIEKRDVARAVLEGISFELRLALDALAAQIPIADLLQVVGGGAKSDVWLSIYADIFEKNILRTTVIRETAALGAAALAFRGAGIWEDFEPIQRLIGRERVFSYSKENAALYRKIRERFEKFCFLLAELDSDATTNVK